MSEPIVWTLDGGLTLVRLLQPLTRDYGYHLTIGGGVINCGFSRKDLDLFFLPLDNDVDVPRPDALLQGLVPSLGPYEHLIDTEYVGHDLCHHKVKFANNGHRVDVFIL